MEIVKQSVIETVDRHYMEHHLSKISLSEYRKNVFILSCVILLMVFGVVLSC